jgi:methyl-accepting chemotaxis protein
MLGHSRKIALSLSNHSHSFEEFSKLTAIANSEIIKSIEEISLGAEQQAALSEKSSVLIYDLDAEMNEIANYTYTMKKTGIHIQNIKVAETLKSFQHIDASSAEISAQMEQISLKVEQVKIKNDLLNETLQMVAAIAEETAAGVQEVNSTSLQLDVSVRRIAVEAVDINGLSQTLFAEIDQFEIADHLKEVGLINTPEVHTYDDSTQEISENGMEAQAESAG